MSNKKILILGDAEHGKDTLARLIGTVNRNSDMKVLPTSPLILDIFLFEVLNDKYNFCYRSKAEAYHDRYSKREIWNREISNYNKDDKLRLVKEVLEHTDVYIGLRDWREVEQAIKEGLFDIIIGIYDYRKPLESNKSNTVNVFEYSDIVVTNNSDVGSLMVKVNNKLKGII